MRNLLVTIIDRKSPASASVKISFIDVNNFMKKVDDFIDTLPFYKVELEFESDLFTESELEILKEKNFLY